MKTKIGLVLGIFLLITVAGAQTPDPVVGAETYLLPAGPVAKPMNLPINFIDYVGSPEEIGTTWYDYQHNSSMSRMTAYGDDGSVHCSWMNGLASGAAQRVIYYNKKDPSGTWVYGTTGIQVNTTLRCGYCTLDLDVAGDAVITYHGYDTGTTNYIFVWNSTGEHALPGYPPGVTDLAWPHVCVDVRDYIHVVCATNPTAKIYYTRSEDGGLTWTDWALVVDWGSGGGVSQTICSDLATGKVAIGYCRQIGTSYLQEDVYYVESLDGVTWDFANPVNITDFGGGVHPMSSSTRAWADVNLLYDHNGDLHAAYTSVPYPTFTNAGMIWHWSDATGHRKVTGTFEETSWISFNNPGAWNSCINKPHLSEDDADVLYSQWSQCTTPGDESAGGFGNRDVYATYSTDGGMNWMSPVNVTDTPSPAAPPGMCMSEHWANMAKVATDKLHIQYILDLDAGGMPQNEGTWTLNPVRYQGVPVDSILTGMVVTLVPDTLPIVIPPTGGSFNYTITVANQGLYTVHFDAWIDVELPSGSIYPLIQRSELTLLPGYSITRTLTQNIPGGAPAGNYTYMAHVGDYEWNIWGEESFPFSKSGVDASAGGTWSCSGWDEPQETGEAIPETHLVTNAYPNPFNPMATISFDLPRPSLVNLTIYDLSGRLVASLTDGWRDAGTHEVTFDGSNLASGVYIYRLNAGEATASGKMVLMK